METILVTWTAPDGRVWPLTGPDAVIRLATGQKGLGWAEAQHVHAPGGAIVATTMAEHPIDLYVEFPPDLTGLDYYRLSSDFWEGAVSPYRYGTLSFIRPDGAGRHRRCRLAPDGSTEYRLDPGLQQERAPQLLPLVSPDPFWRGPEQVITAHDTPGGTGKKFYGDHLGVAFPFYIGGAQALGEHRISNPGAGPMWLRWTLTGPLTSPSFGHGDSLLTYDGEIAAGEQVVVVTEPGRREVYEVESEANRYAHVTGAWDPLPRADEIIVRVSDVDNGGSIVATGSVAYATPI